MLDACKLRGRMLASVALLWACRAENVSVGAWSPESPPANVAPATLYLEAEAGELSGGFSVGDDEGASGGRFLAAPGDASFDSEPGPARATYRLQIPVSGEYVLWGRIRAPNAVNNRFWFQVDGGSWHKWRISVGDIWYWDDLHEDTSYAQPLVFSLSQGSHELVLANCVDGVALDRLYLTAAGDTPQGNETACRPPHSIEVAGECLLSCGVQRGQTCGAAACAGHALIDAYDCDVCCRLP